MSEEQPLELSGAFEDVLGSPEAPVGAKTRVRARLNRRVKVVRRRRRIFASAGLVAVATLSAVLVTRVTVGRPQEPKPPGELVARTEAAGAPLGEGRFVFADGSSIMVGANSGVSLLSDGKRGTLVRLSEGTVVASVEERDDARPFVVLANDVRVEVVGTVFEVASHQDIGVRVHVYEGRVFVRDSGNETTVDAGHSWPAGAAPTHTEPDNHSGPATVGADDSDAGVAEAAPARVDGPTKPAQIATFREARDFERDGRVTHALRAYRAIAEGRGADAEDALFAVGRVLRTKKKQPQGALNAFRQYRKRYVAGRYSIAADVHIIELLLEQRRWHSVETEASRFLQGHPQDPRAVQFRIARATSRAQLGDCDGALSDTHSVPRQRVPELVKVRCEDKESRSTD